MKSSNLLKNHKIAKHISNASWYSCVEKLEYKARLYNKNFIKIDQWYASSKTCHCCGYKVKEMPLSVRMWDYPSCHIKNMDRDINAAINLKNQGILGGLSVTACRVGVRRDFIHHATVWETRSIAI